MVHIVLPSVCPSFFCLSVFLSVSLSVRLLSVWFVSPLWLPQYWPQAFHFFLSNFSVSLNLFLTRLKTFIRQLSIYSGRTHPLPVETLVDSFGTTGTGSETRKRVTTTMWKREDWMFWWLKRYLKVLRHKMPQILTDLQLKTGKLCSGSSTLCDRTDRAQFPYFVGQIRTPVFCM